MKEWTALNRTWLRYGAAVLLIQGLAACDRPGPAPGSAPQAATPAPVATSATPAAPRQAARPVGAERLVLAFGDSLYAGFNLEPGESLPDAVEARLRRDGINAEVVNAGVSGDTTAAGRQRLAFALDNLPRKPDLVILGLGGNDLLRQIPPAETRTNLTAMLDTLSRRGVPVLLTGMLAPPNLGPDYRGQFDRIWPELAGKYNATLYPFILDGVIGNPQLMQPDRVHPTARGVERIADALAPLAAERLKADPA